MTTVEENKRIVHRIQDEIVDQDDLDAVEELFTEDVAFHGPIGDFTGREVIKESFKMNRDGFSDYTITYEDIISEGDTVAVRLTERGTHDGEFLGHEPTGKEFEHQTMSFLRLEDGKIAEWWITPDNLGLMQQLGLKPEDFSAPVPADDD